LKGKDELNFIPYLTTASKGNLYFCAFQHKAYNHIPRYMIEKYAKEKFYINKFCKEGNIVELSIDNNKNIQR